jgi:malate synthase
VAAIGGISAQIHIKGDEKANNFAMNKDRTDQLREVTNGPDGTWVAYSSINKIVRAFFDEHMLGPNRVRSWLVHGNPLLRRATSGGDVRIAAADLLNTKVPEQVTSKGVRSTVLTALAHKCLTWWHLSKPSDGGCCNGEDCTHSALTGG